MSASARSVILRNSGLLLVELPETATVPSFDRLDRHGGASSPDSWKSIFWLQQRPGEPSAQAAYAHGRQAYRLHPLELRGVSHALVRQDFICWVQAHFDTVDDPAIGARCRRHRRRYGGERLAVDGCRGVQVDEVADPVDGPVGGTGDHHAPIAVANQDRVAQFLEVQQVDDVGDVAVQVDTAAKQVRPLAQTRQGRGVNLVPAGPQQRATGW
jgi:hypothetical protein